MSLHTAVYTSSIAQNAILPLTAQQDDSIPITNNHLLPQEKLYLVSAAGFSANINRLRVYSPSLRIVGLNHIRPLMASAQAQANPVLCTYTNNPLPFAPLEEIVVDAQQGSAGAQQVYAVLTFTTGLMPAPQGSVIRIHATGTTTGVVNAWTSVPLTFDDTLQSGVYSIVGATFVSATAVAGRLLIDGTQYRPGSVGLTSLANAEHVSYTNRWLGVFGQFKYPNLPRCQFFSTAADTAQDVFLDVIRISS